MSEQTLVNELRLAAQTVDLPRRKAWQLIERAAATIEALQARVAELEARPPSSREEGGVCEVCSGTGIDGHPDSGYTCAACGGDGSHHVEARPPSSPDTDEARAFAASLWPGDGSYDVSAESIEDAADKIYRLSYALDAARAECERLRGLLREIQWSGYIEGGPISDGGEWYPDCCPWCGEHRRGIGHAAGCPCAAALGDGQ